MTKPRDFHRADMRIAYPWPVEVQMPDNVTGIGIDEAIYGASGNEEQEAEGRKANS